MWNSSKRVQGTVAVLAIVLLSGFVIAHSAHSFHIHQRGLSADVSDGCLLCANPAIAHSSLIFVLPQLAILSFILLIHDPKERPIPVVVEERFTRPPPAKF